MKSRRTLTGCALAILVVASGATAVAQHEGSPQASVKQLQAALERDPADPTLYVSLGLAYWNEDDDSHALEAFQRAVKVGPRSAEAHNWLGVALLKKADLPGAVGALKKAVELDPKYGRAYTNLGAALVQSGDVAEAIEVFEKALLLEPNNLAAHMNLGLALRDKGDLDGALAHLRRVAAADQSNAGIQYEFAQTLRQSGDLHGAIAAFERALEINPELREGYYALGVALRQQSAAARKPSAPATSPADNLFEQAREGAGRGDLNAAREQLTRILSLDENHAEAHNLLGFILGQQGDLSSALPHLERASALRPESAEARYNLGVALWYGGSRARALSELRESIRRDPAAGGSHAFLGAALREEGDLAAARVSLQRAIALLPPTAAIYIDLGITYLRAGELEKAMGQLEAGLNLQSSSPPAPDWDSAITGLRKALTAKANVETRRSNDDPAEDRRNNPVASPLDPSRVSGSPRAASSGDEAQGALSTSRRAGLNPRVLSVLPGNALAEAHNVLGLLLGRRGAATSEVAGEFREAIRLRPDFAEAHNHLGLVLIQAGDDEAGVAALREAVRISPDYAEAHVNLGAALTPTDAEEAIRELEKAVALAPASVKAQFNLAVAYGSSPNHGAAREIEQLRKVIELTPVFARARLALGRALLRDAKVPEAIVELQEAARLEPKNGEAHYQLGLALARAGRKDEATAELQKGRELVAADDRDQNANLDIAEGRAALEQGDLEQAAARLRHAIKIRPESSEAQRYLGAVLEKQGNTESAAAAYRKALELNPADLSARTSLDQMLNAAGLAARGESPTAFDRRCIPADCVAPPSNIPDILGRRALSSGRLAGLGATPDFHHGLPDDPGRVAELEGYIRQGKYKDVEPLLHDYVKQRPQSSWGWYALGYSLFAQQKIGDSIQALAKSLERDIRNAEAHKMLGRSLMIIGRFDAAQVEFEQGIRYKPGSAEIHYNLGKLFSIQDNWEPARKAFESALRINPSFVEALDALGFALEALADDAGAVANYEKAIALNEAQHGSFSSAHVNLSAYYNRTGDPVKALEYASKAIELDPRSDRAWFQRARADERQGRLNEAVDSVNRAISFNARASSYYYVLAGLYRRLGNMDESRKALESFTRLERETSELEKMRRNATQTAPRPPREPK